MTLLAWAGGGAEVAGGVSLFASDAACSGSAPEGCAENFHCIPCTASPDNGRDCGDGEDDAVPVVTRAVQEMGLDATAGSNTVTDGDSVDGADEKPAPGGRSRKGNRGVPMQVPIGHRSATVNGSTVTLCVEDVHASAI